LRTRIESRIYLIALGWGDDVSGTGRILLVDDDLGTLVGYSGILRCAGFDIRTAMTATECLTLLKSDDVDLVLCDLRLPDMSALDILRTSSLMRWRTRFVIVSGHGTVTETAEAFRLGAKDFVEKPLFDTDLINVVTRCLPEGTRSRTTGGGAQLDKRHFVSPAARRWARLACAATSLAVDPKTIAEWARSAGVARGTLCIWCAAAGVKPKLGFDFARLLRCVVRHGGESWAFRDILDVVDPRTLDRLLARAGMPAMVPSVETFLRTQTLIHSDVLIGAVEEALTESPVTA
jgi:DNA-binding response OmpR family regulator